MTSAFSRTRIQDPRMHPQYAREDWLSDGMPSLSHIKLYAQLAQPTYRNRRNTLHGMLTLMQFSHLRSSYPAPSWKRKADQFSHSICNVVPSQWRHPLTDGKRRIECRTLTMVSRTGQFILSSILAIIFILPIAVASPLSARNGGYGQQCRKTQVAVLGAGIAGITAAVSHSHHSPLHK
jgi:hypothetical protein